MTGTMVDATTAMPNALATSFIGQANRLQHSLDLETFMKHRFATGQRVRLRPAHLALPAGSGSFKIISALPIERAGEIRYRIKSEAENFERVADESTLSLTV